MPKNPRQTIAPDHFTSTALSENSWRILGKVTENEVTLVRYFLSKIVYTDEVVTLEETCILFLSFEKMVQKMSQHEAYRAKYGSEVFTFRSIFTSLEDVVSANPQDRLLRMREVFGFYRGKLFSHVLLLRKRSIDKGASPQGTHSVPEEVQAEGVCGQRVRRPRNCEGNGVRWITQLARSGHG